MTRLSRISLNEEALESCLVYIFTARALHYIVRTFYVRDATYNDDLTYTRYAWPAEG